MLCQQYYQGGLDRCILHVGCVCITVDMNVLNACLHQLYIQSMDGSDLREEETGIMWRRFADVIILEPVK